MNFDPIEIKAKNKVSVGDKILIEDRVSIVISCTRQHIILDNNSTYPTKLFNKWIRIARQIKERKQQADERLKKIDKVFQDLIIMRKEAKVIYDEKWRRKALNYMGIDTMLRKYIVITGVGATIKFYMSPTHKADVKDLENSYKSLHGTAYKAFAWGYYIRHENNVALIGMQSYLGRNTSNARKEFAVTCINNERTPGCNKLNAKLYIDMNHFMISPRVIPEESKLLSSPAEPTKVVISKSVIEEEIEDDSFPF